MGWLARLPLSLLFVSLAFAATAAPIAQDFQGLSLTPDTFKPTIDKGVWLVEHFSPYCHHCREFAPTWDLLAAANTRASNPGIRLAQIDCAIHGDLCDDNNVEGYPQINLYRDGKFVEVFKGRRDLDVLQEYIKKHADPAAISPQGRSDATTVEPPVDPNPLGTVLVLDASNFDKVVSQGPVFIKFFAPWCGHCKRLAPTWAQLARHMQHTVNIAEIDCEDNAAICKSQGIQGYPSLFYYSGGSKSEYVGGRKFDQLKAFTVKASAPPVQQLLGTDLEPHLSQNPVVYLLLHSKTYNHIVNQIARVSQVLLGSPPIFASTSAELFTRYNIPTASLSSSSPWVLLAFKDRDAVHPTAKFFATPSSFDSKELESWLFGNRLPTTLELTQDTFQEVMKAPHRPLVVIAAVTKDTKDKVADRFKDIGKVWRVRKGQGKGGDRDVVFAWMDAGKWANWLKSMYGIAADSGSDPAIVIADHSQLTYYDTDQNGQPIKLTSASIFSVVDGIARGIISPKHSENIVERMARYLNTKLTSLEIYVTSYPLRTVLVFVVLLIAVFLSLRYCVSESAASHHPHGNGKSGRLD